MSGSGGVGTVEHVDDDDRDVVAPALAVGQRDELVGGRLRVARRSWQHLDDVVVADLVDEAVAAQQEAVAAHDAAASRRRRARRVDAEGAGDDVAAGVGAGLVVGDVAGGDELLDVAVVDGDAPQPAVAQEVGARVADVDERELLAAAVGLGGRLGAVAGVPFAGSVITTSAVTVVPMPCWSGLPIGGAGRCRRWPRRSPPTTSSSVGADGARAATRSRSTASALATSPARWPPMPSATAKTLRLGEQVVLVVRAGSGPESVAAPQRSVGHYCASSTV